MEDNDQTFQESVMAFFNQCFETLDKLETEEKALNLSTGSESLTPEKVTNLVTFKEHKIAKLEELLSQYRNYKQEAVKRSLQGDFMDDLLQMEPDIVRELNGVRNELNDLQKYNIL